jgi:hypothetical protein
VTLSVTLRKWGELKDSIDKLLAKNPQLSNHKVAEILGIDWKKHSHYIRNRRWLLKKKGVISDTYGSPHVAHPNLHRLRFVYPLGVLTPDHYSRLNVRAMPASSDKNATTPVGIWVRSGNRNRQLTFRSEHSRITVWPTGRLQIYCSGLASAELMRDETTYALFVGGAITEKEAPNFPLPDLVAEHRAFPVGGPMPRFKIDYYKPALGLTALTDLSHPWHLEFIEESPPWVNQLIMSNISYAKNLETHVEVLAKINESFKAWLDLMKSQPEQPKGEPEYRG